MYKKILLPIDGSEISVASANAGITFAKYLGAEIVALNVEQPFSTVVGFDGVSAAYAISEEDYNDSALKETKRYLAPILERATAVGIKASIVTTFNYNVAEAIVNVCKEQSCDLIFMSSNCRSGLSRLLLGSVTSKVLELANCSVFVHRLGQNNPS